LQDEFGIPAVAPTESTHVHRQPVAAAFAGNCASSSVWIMAEWASRFCGDRQTWAGSAAASTRYDEIVYVIEGRSKWTLGDQEREASAGDILIVRAREPHKFINSGDGPLRQLDIHLNPTFETVWLEE